MKKISSLQNKKRNTMINQLIGCWSNKRKMNMSYREMLLKQIRELELKIAEAQGDKAVLEKELNRLQIAEFEEEMRESSEQRLLKG